ncbi:Cu-Zn family superoxide dismutase [Thalassobacillus devorans]|uniref:superoxide dismutase family protein n=1 Tax=Thalassobacillus devorans TaxID=279813 RepID=UPI0007864C80|nr:superoxide dismutase family protein [Thalassobacillus devorans]NIK28171.1 Cu-Zn family superoxide dismutase [Thalassobacillus devorans]
MYNYGYPAQVNYYPAPFRQQPKQARARIQGGPLAEGLTGDVYFYELPYGVEVFIQVQGLPEYQPGENGKKQVGPHGFHIHENGSCQIGDESDPFQAAGGHWNPDNQPHGNHAGDFPVLFSNEGFARMMFFTSRFKVDDVIGKAVIIHESPDDYQSQPAGDAGKRLACGVIQKV